HRLQRTDRGGGGVDGGRRAAPAGARPGAAEPHAGAGARERHAGTARGGAGAGRGGDDVLERGGTGLPGVTPTTGFCVGCGRPVSEGALRCYECQPPPADEIWGGGEQGPVPFRGPVI